MRIFIDIKNESEYEDVQQWLLENGFIWVDNTNSVIEWRGHDTIVVHLPKKIFSHGYRDQYYPHERLNYPDCFSHIEDALFGSDEKENITNIVGVSITCQKRDMFVGTYNFSYNDFDRIVEFVEKYKDFNL